MVSWRVRRSAPRPLTIGVTASAQHVFDGSDDCLLAPDGGCVPNFPHMQSVGLLIGVGGSSVDPSSDNRLLVGPAVIHALEVGKAPGLVVRGDIGMPARWRLAFTLWGQGAVVPRLKKETYAFWTLGVGFRVR